MNNDVLQAYIVRNKNLEILRQSTSGGFFYSICKYVIEKNGVVFGVVIDEHYEIKHTYSTNLEDCICFLGSKYVQSSMPDSFEKAEGFLKLGKLVCFSGTPCQIAGLKSFLRKEYDNLILIDIVCHGVCSRKVWKDYIENKKKKGIIKGINFRSKHFGYQNATMEILYEHKTYHGTSRIDEYLKVFYSNIALRPSCYNCKFKGIKRVSDFTMYDCWNASDILNISDDDLGYTNLIVQSDRGLQILDNISRELFEYKVELSDILPKTGGMVTRSAPYNKKRKNFFDEYNKNGFISAINKCQKVSFNDRFVEAFKLATSRFAFFRKISKRRRSKNRKE